MSMNRYLYGMYVQYVPYKATVWHIAERILEIMKGAVNIEIEFIKLARLCRMIGIYFTSMI